MGTRRPDIAAELARARRHADRALELAGEAAARAETASGRARRSCAKWGRDSRQSTAAVSAATSPPPSCASG